MQNLGLESVDLDNEIEANLGRFDQFLKQHRNHNRGSVARI
jgi:hypothetical protein